MTAGEIDDCGAHGVLIHYGLLSFSNAWIIYSSIFHEKIRICLSGMHIKLEDEVLCFVFKILLMLLFTDAEMILIFD